MELVDKVEKTIKKNGIPKYVGSWKGKKPTEFKNEEKFQKQMQQYVGQYHKHSKFHRVVMRSRAYTVSQDTLDRPLPRISMGKDRIITIKVKHFYNSHDAKVNRKAEDKFVKCLHQIDKYLESSRGMIIDLTQHRGGNMWPFILGMSNVYGSASLLAFDNKKTSPSSKKWFYLKDRSIMLGRLNNKQLQYRKPIVVIVSKHTGSSGEIIASTFTGRKNVWMIGKGATETAGYLSINDGFWIGKREYNLILTVLLVVTVDGKIHYNETLKVPSLKRPMERARKWILESPNSVLKKM